MKKINEQEFKEMVSALTSKRILKPLEKVEKDSKRRHFNETSPELLYKRRAEQQPPPSSFLRSSMKPVQKSDTSLFFKSLN